MISNSMSSSFSIWDNSKGKDKNAESDKKGTAEKSAILLLFLFWFLSQRMSLFIIGFWIKNLVEVNEISNPNKSPVAKKSKNKFSLLSILWLIITEENT